MTGTANSPPDRNAQRKTWLPPNENDGLQLIYLAVFHVGLGTLFTTLSLVLRDDGNIGDHTVAISLGVVTTQMCLLALWAAMGSAPSWARVFVLWVGVGYLVFSLGLSMDDFTFPTVAITTLTTAGIYAILILTRMTGRNLQDVRGLDLTGVREALQFTLGHLFVAIFVSACLVTAVRLALQSSTGTVILVFVAIFGANSITAVWAVLGLGNPLRRLLVPVGATAISIQLIGRFGGSEAWYLVMITQVTLLVGSLAIVRSAGYRFLKSAPPDSNW